MPNKEQEPEDEDVDDPLAIIDKLRSISRKPVELKFSEKYLNSFKVAEQTFSLNRK